MATDLCGNISSGVQMITVTDTTPPILAPLQNKIITAGEPLIFDVPKWLDNSGSATVFAVATFTNSSSPEGYLVTRLWKASDACGNLSNIRMQTVTILPAAPIRLTISLVPPTGSQQTSLGSTPMILLAWPTNAVDYRLEFADSPNAKRWSPVAVTPIMTNNEFRVYVPRTGTSRFFRIVNTAPYLESTRFFGNVLKLTWPTAPSGFQLEASDTMAPGSWTPVPVEPSVSDALNHVTVRADAAKKFYRLKK